MLVSASTNIDWTEAILFGQLRQIEAFVSAAGRDFLVESFCTLIVKDDQIGVEGKDIRKSAATSRYQFCLVINWPKDKTRTVSGRSVELAARRDMVHSMPLPGADIWVCASAAPSRKRRALSHRM